VKLTVQPDRGRLPAVTLTVSVNPPFQELCTLIVAVQLALEGGVVGGGLLGGGVVGGGVVGGGLLGGGVPDEVNGDSLLARSVCLAASSKVGS
jgi:hypothetical protein